MRITDAIRQMFTKNKNTLLLPALTWNGWEGISCLPFGELVFQNVVELLTDLNNDVTFANLTDKQRMTFAEFVRFFNDEGETTLWQTYRQGYAVIGYKWSEEGSAQRFVTNMRLLNENEYTKPQDGGATYIRAIDDAWRVYVMKSQTWRIKGISDYQLCKPAIEFLDNTMNASNTSLKKLGAVVIASPENGTAAPTAAVLNEKDKKDMEETISKEYGLLNRQKQIMLLPRGMRFDTISLTGIDTKLTERVKLNVELIADRIKVPASQIAVIDATAGKSLSNGGEVHEGDRLKYKTYERLLNKTFIQFAEALGLSVTYTIYNKPADAVTGEISEQG